MQSDKFASARHSRSTVCWLLLLLLPATVVAQQPVRTVPVELQPLAAHVKRVVEALDYLGAPLAPIDKQALEQALNETDAGWASRAIQDVLDKYRLLDVYINPESRVRVTQGVANPELVQHGWRTFLVKVRNEAGVTAPLVVDSLNALPVYARSKNSPQSPLGHSPKPSITQSDVANRWLDAGCLSKFCVPWQIAEKERATATTVYEHARQVYRRLLAEAESD